MENTNELETILIADDESVNRSILKRIFQTEYTVLEAQDGEEALRVLRESKDIIGVILDLQMPRLNGFGVMQAMQADPVLSCIPVIVVTASEDSETQTKALAYGAVDVIVKPFNPVVIRLRLRRLVALLRASKLEEENKWLKERVHLSEIDAKTGLLNKQTFCLETQKLLQSDPNGSYAMFRWDIDNFKVFNDSFGTRAGDELLRKIGEKCLGYAERNPVLCAQGHYDADHFVSLWKKDGLDPERFYRTVLAMLRDIFPDYTFSIHFGIYTFDGQTFDVGIMCDRALLALRSVKTSYNVHYAWYCEDMRTGLIEEQSVVSSMKDALHSGQFVPYFQPIKYIPIFEKNGFIYELDHYMWEQVCILLKSWKDKGLSTPSISVNISRRDLYHPGLVDEFKNLIKTYGLDASMLHLEITESAYVDNPELVLGFVAELQSAGFKVELDDFGSGYSSLNTLKDVHVDLLKLDMAFITPNTDHSRGGSILTSVVSMAHAIRLPVIAEGVETRQQADYLKSIGCLYMQGYYFAKPMPVDDFEELIRTGKSVTMQDPRFKPGFDNSIDFLDATTQSTLLFNSFVGGAAIMEYRGKNVAALRLNDRYYEVLEITAAEYIEKQYHLAETIAPEYRQAFLDTLDTAIRTGKEADCKIRTIALREGAQPLYVHCRVRLLADKVDSHVFYMSIENITQRILSQTQNDMYHNIIVNLPVGVAVYEMSDQVRPCYINDITCRMFGFTREEYDRRLNANLPVNFMPDEDVLAPDARQRLERGEVLSLRFRARRQDGSAFWLRAVLRLVAGEGDAPLLYASFIDVTDVIEAESKISAQQQVLSAIISTVPGGIFKYSADNDQFTFVSEPMLSWLGYTKEEFTEKFQNRFSQMIYEGDREDTLAKIKSDIAKTGSTDSCEYRIETKSGELQWVHDAGRLIVDENGDRWYIVVIVDIYERKRLELALEAAQEKTDALLRNIPNGITCYKYVNGVKRIEYANDSLLGMLGYTREELFGADAPAADALIHPDDLPALRAAKTGALRTGEPLRQECRILKKDGSYLWVSIDGNFIMQAPGTGLLYTSFADITQRKLLQEQQKQDRQQIEMLLSSIPGGLGTYELRPDGFRVIYASQGVPAISGRTTDEYLALFNEEHKSDIYPADEPLLHEHLRKALETGGNIDNTYRVQHVNGQIIWVDMHGTFSGTQNGFPVFHAVFHNPSETTALYRAIIDETDSALTVTDYKTRELLFANRAAQEISGETQVIGMPCYRYLMQRTSPCEDCMVENLSDAPVCREITINGRRYFSRMTRINWNGHDSFVTYMADRTELYASQDRLNAVLRNIPGGLAAFHVKGTQVLRTYISEGALSVLGYAKNEPVDDNMFGTLSRVHPADRATLKDTIRASTENRLPFNTDMRVIPQAGGLRWVNLVANPVEMDGELYFYGIYSDVTEQKRTKEAALAERERQIAEYQRELRQLAATQSEDLLAKLSVDLTDAVLESSWARDDSGISYDGVSEYDEVCRRIAAAGLTRNQQRAIAAVLDRGHLLASFEKGENQSQFEFQRRAPSGRIYWVRSAVKIYLDPESGHIKMFLYTFDIDGKKTPALLMERLLSLQVEMLGVIDVQAGTVYHYRCAETDCALSPANDTDYADRLRAFAARYLPEERRAEFLKKLSLEQVLSHLPDIDSKYGYSFWMTYAGRRCRKSCSFSYMDESATTVIMMRTDTTDDFLRQEAQRNELDAAQAEVERSKLDGVTGIYNRITTETLISQKLTIPENGRCAFILLDLDDLKKMNDQLGHLQGDRALQAIAAILKKHFRSTDIFGRIGGDEFVAFLTGVRKKEDLHATLNSLLRELSRFRVGENDDFTIHCSIGCTLGECGTDDFKELYKQADTALYHVKRNGKNDYAFYSPEMQAIDSVRAGHPAISLRDELAVNRQQLNRLMDAISTYYPLVVSVNLTQDRYFLMESSAYVVSHIPASGSYHSFLLLNGKAIHPEDKKAFSIISRSALLAAYDEGKHSVQTRVRQLDVSGSAYRWMESTAVFYKDDDGDVCAFFFARPAEGKRRELELLLLRRIMELSAGSGFEYICLLHADTGYYEVYAGDGKNALGIPRSGKVNDTVRFVRDTCLPPEQRDAFYDSAIIEHVTAGMERNDGYYSYRYEFSDCVREAEFFWYETSHNEILMTIRSIPEQGEESPRP